MSDYYKNVLSILFLFLAHFCHAQFGQEIKSIRGNKLIRENIIKLSIEDLPGDIYFLKIGIGEKEMLRKIIKY